MAVAATVISLLAGIIVAAVSALGSMIAAVATLIALYQLS